VAGFGLLVLVLAVVVGGSVWMISRYQSHTAEMQAHSETALLLHEGETHTSIAALLVQRYVLTGESQWLGELQLSAAASLTALASARDNIAEYGDPAQLARAREMQSHQDSLTSGLAAVLALRQAGDIDGAAARMEQMVPEFTDFRRLLRETVQTELQTVEDLDAQVNQTGDLALMLLIISGVSGGIFGLIVSGLIARSIIKPLSSLEATAKAVSSGDMTARAPVAGPRELARLGETLNRMVATIQERTDELRLSNEELRDRNHQLIVARTEATTDSLTGLMNHRKFHGAIRVLVTDAMSSGRKVGLVMVDVDNFKQINDSLGHLRGDEVLRDLAQVMATVAQPENLYRYGGDEFAITVPDADVEATKALALRVQGAVQEAAAIGEAVTISLGVATFPDMAANAEELIYRADMALNWAKSSGKDRVGDWDSLLRRKDPQSTAEASPPAVTAQ